MLDHLGFPELETLVMQSIEATMTTGLCTPDLGGTAQTQEVTDRICHQLKTLSGKLA